MSALLVVDPTAASLPALFRRFELRPRPCPFVPPLPPEYACACTALGHLALLLLRPFALPAITSSIEDARDTHPFESRPCTNGRRTHSLEYTIGTRFYAYTRQDHTR